jgi:hypothetical protein
MSSQRLRIGTSSLAAATGLRGRVSHSFPSPLPIEPEELVVVEIVDGQADLTLVHLPAHKRIDGGRGGPTFDRYDFSPSVWPSACRLIEDGYVYVRAGLLADAPVCAECEAAA